MKYILECVELLIKIIAIGVTIFGLYIIFFDPNRILSVMKPVVDRYSKENYDVEFSLLGVKLSLPAAPNPAVKELGIVDAEVAELKGTILCLNDKNLCGATNIESPSSAPSLERALEISTNIATNQATLEKTKITIGTDNVPVSQAWIILTSSAREFADAAFDRNQLATLGVDTDIIYSANRYRTVAVLDTREKAGAMINRVFELRGRSDAYIRLLSAWCKDFERVLEDEKTYLSCERINIKS